MPRPFVGEVRVIRFGILLMLALLCLMPLTDVVAQSRCENAVTQAQDSYELGRTAEVILLLSNCLPDSIPEVERVQAYKILALAYLNEDYPDKAQLAINDLLDLNENYEPDFTQDDQRFIDLITKEKARRSEARSKKRKWFIVGGTVLAAGAATAIILSTGGTSAQRLPDPPTFPGDQ